MAVIGAEPASKSRDDSTRKTCEIQNTTGSRLGAVRVCRTKAERAQAKAEEREVVERVQSRKAMNGN